MFKLHKLTPNGSSMSVSVPRTFAHHLGWQMGQHIIVELLEDGTLWLRRPTSRDYAAISANEPPDKARPSVSA